MGGGGNYFQTYIFDAEDRAETGRNPFMLLCCLKGVVTKRNPGCRKRSRRNRDAFRTDPF